MCLGIAWIIKSRTLISQLKQRPPRDDIYDSKCWFFFPKFNWFGAFKMQKQSKHPMSQSNASFQWLFSMPDVFILSWTLHHSWIEAVPEHSCFISSMLTSCCLLELFHNPGCLWITALNFTALPLQCSSIHSSLVTVWSRLWWFYYITTSLFIFLENRIA